MHPLEPPSPQPPTQPPAPDEPRSRKPPRATVAATRAQEWLAPAQIDISWSTAATRALSENSDKRALNLVARHAIKRALQEAQPLYPALQTQLKSIEAPQWELDLGFSNDLAMQQLNAEHRGKDKPTDVLSFPVWEGDFVFPLPPGETSVMLGDMVISIETAARQAQELKHDLRAEVAFLAVHGTLHLLGYDHDSDSKRRRMFALQDEIVAHVREDEGF